MVWGDGVRGLGRVGLGCIQLNSNSLAIGVWREYVGARVGTGWRIGRARNGGGWVIGACAGLRERSAWRTGETGVARGSEIEEVYGSVGIC
jgi:hypothetical protein